MKPSNYIKLYCYNYHVDTKLPGDHQCKLYIVHVIAHRAKMIIICHTQVTSQAEEAVAKCECNHIH